jgi:hypothetical protein
MTVVIFCVMQGRRIEEFHNILDYAGDGRQQSINAIAPFTIVGTSELPGVVIQQRQHTQFEHTSA